MASLFDQGLGRSSSAVRLRMPLASVPMLAAVVAAACFVGYVFHEHAIPRIAPPARSSFEPATVTQGAALAAIGDCAICHKAAGSRPYGGGRPLPTPFGTLFVSNITPDASTGIGTWSLEAFRRAMRHGIGRDGTHLYPILRFEQMPGSVDIVIVDRPGDPFLGTAECAQGPASAALANTVAAATGLRLRRTPHDPAAGVRVGLAGLGTGLTKGVPIGQVPG